MQKISPKISPKTRPFFAKNVSKSRVNFGANLAGGFSFFLDMLYTFRVSLRATLWDFRFDGVGATPLYVHFIRVSFPVSLFYRVSFSMLCLHPSASQNTTGTEQVYSDPTPCATMTSGSISRAPIWWVP